jgi:hypothetical protein
LKQGKQPSLKLVQDENEEGYESEVPPDMGENLMIRRSMVISKKEQRQSSNNEYPWLRTNIFEPNALSGERYVKLLLIMAIVRIWFPKRW